MVNHKTEKPESILEYSSKLDNQKYLVQINR